GDGAGCDSRHRARGRLVSQLHKAAAGALRHAVDPAAGVSDDRVAGRLPAIAGGVPRPAPGTRRSEPHPRRDSAQGVVAAHLPAPLVLTSVVATWCFVFIGVIRELSATVMLTTANTKVVAVIIYDLNESGDLGAISVLGITLLLITFAVVGVANRLPMLGRAPA